MDRWLDVNTPTLYGITDEILTPQKTILSQVELALKNGVKIIQYRDKKSKDEEIFFTCKELKSLCEAYGAMFVINDRLNLASTLNAHALHVGKDDTSLEVARNSFKGVIGVSCYGDINRAKKAIKEGADYVAFGSFFPSPTKPNSLHVSGSILKLAKDLPTKVAVIGGINSENISYFKSFRVDMICAISAIFHGDIKKNIQKLKAKIENFTNS